MTDGLSEYAKRGELMGGTVEITLREAPEWPIQVRPVLDDLVGGWMPNVEESLLKYEGSVVGVSGNDALLTASVGSTIAAWTGARGRQVTLIDACLDTPVVAKALLDDGDEGLVDAVAFGVSTSVVARRTLVASVNLVTAGSRPISTSRVLGADAFRVVLDKLARDGALVLVVLPREDLERALWALDCVIAVGRTAEDVSSIEEITTDPARPGLRNVIRLLVNVPGVPPQEERRVSLTEVSDDVDDRPDDGGHDPDDSEEERSDVGTYAGVTSASVDPFEPDDTVAEVTPQRRSRLWIVLVAVVIVGSLGAAWQYGLMGTRGGPELEEDVAGSVTLQDTLVSGRAADAPVMSNESTLDAAEEMPAEELMQAEGEDAVDGGAADDTASDAFSFHPATVGERPDWPAASVGLYVVFTSSHRRETDALYDMGALLVSGLPAMLVAVELEESGAWYRVAVDAGFGGVSDATDLLETVRELGYDGAWIERLRQQPMDIDYGE